MGRVEAAAGTHITSHDLLREGRCNDDFCIHDDYLETIQVYYFSHVNRLTDPFVKSFSAKT